jgi:hypothetical protein
MFRAFATCLRTDYGVLGRNTLVCTSPHRTSRRFPINLSLLCNSDQTFLRLCVYIFPVPPQRWLFL